MSDPPSSFTSSETSKSQPTLAALSALWAGAPAMVASTCCTGLYGCRRGRLGPPEAGIRSAGAHPTCAPPAEACGCFPSPGAPGRRCAQRDHLGEVCCADAQPRVSPPCCLQAWLIRSQSSLQLPAATLPRAPSLPVRRAQCTGNSVGLLPPRSGGELLPAGVLNGPAFARGPILLKKAFLFFYLRCARVVVVAVAV